MWIVSASALTAGWCTWLCIIWSIKANGSEADCHSLWNTAWFTCLRLSFCSHMHTLGFCLIDVCVHSCTISGSFPIVNLRELLWQYFLQMSFSSTIISIKALMGDSSWNGGKYADMMGQEHWDRIIVLLLIICYTETCVVSLFYARFCSAKLCC